MIRVYDGKDLARVLIYYGLIDEVVTSEFNINCPFHNDPNPSMKVNLSEGSYFCFGCRANGNAYDFVKTAQPELNDLQAAVILEKILHSDKIKKLNVQYRKKKKKKRWSALSEAKDYYYGIRTTDWNRPTTKEEKAILEYMKRRGFNAKALNVVNCKANYNIAYPILFPIYDNGRFMGWVGRTTNEYVERKRKYLYNDGFYKRDTLCGNYEENKVVFICEGFMDYLSLRTRGHIKNVVAILGWHISDEQVKKLKEKGIKTVVSALDNDKCGIKGTEYLKNFFNVIRFCYPEDKKDAGDMTEQELKEAIKQTKEGTKNEIES
jgi:DNA primase